MGGEVSVDLTEDITHLIANKIGSEKYRVAFSLRIPVVGPAWIANIHEQWKKGQAVDIEKAAADVSLGPLKGCNICLTGFAIDQRLEIQRDTLQYGGKFNSDLLKGATTHLICYRPTGEKYKSALLWGIKCVRRSWLDDTMKNVELADETKYSFDGQDSLPVVHSGRSAAKSHVPNGQVIEDQSILIPDQMYLEACYIFICQSFPVAQVAQIKKMIRVAGGIYVAEYDAHGVTHVLVPSDKIDQRTIALFDEKLPLPFIVNQHWLRRSNQEGKILPEADYIVPFPTRADDGQSKPVRFEGSRTWTTDSAVQKKDPRNLRGNMATLRSRSKSVLAADSMDRGSPQHADLDTCLDTCHNADLESDLTDSSTQQSASEQKETMPTSSVLSSAGKATTSQARNGLKTRTASGLLTAALGDLSVTPTQQTPIADTSLATKADQLNLDEEEESQPANIFVRLYITAHGCKDSVTNAIRKNTPIFGGTYFDETETPPAPDALVRTIVPLSMTWDKARHLKGIVLTNCWFETSLREERVISRNEYFLYKPMKTIPIAGRAIALLGAKFSDKLNTICTNLLISDQPSGPKYEFMAKSGRPIVTMEWLKQCVEQGELLPYDDFLLNPDVSQALGMTPHGSFARTQSMSRQWSDESQRTITSATSTQDGSTSQIAPSDKPLSGLTICLLSRVVGSHSEMQRMITQMGARLLTSYDPSATHFIHKGKATTDAKRDLRAAKRDNLYIVSPEWLYKSRDAGVRANERHYPETYDDKHLTLTTTGLHTPQERPSLAVLTSRGSSPSLRTTSSRSSKKSPAVGFGRSGSSTHRQQSALPSPSQIFQGTAAGATSSMFSTDTLPSSAKISSANNSFDSSLNGTMDSSYSSNGQLDSASVWRPVPYLPVVRSSDRRKRRAAVAGEESPLSGPAADISMVVPSQDDGNDDNSNTEHYFYKSQERYGEDAVYWVDVEGREKKRALMESLGYRTVAPVSQGNNSSSDRDQSGTVTPEHRVQPKFLLTGINAMDRARFKRSIQELGGVVLEEVSDDHDYWKQNCTHLITNGNKPPRTAKLVLAMGIHAKIVHKAFIAASVEKGEWVDEAQFLVK
ncbi:DNA topoisomerase 2-binding protein 1 [Mortierella sp. GBA30]|nr:DNA topoisomerase 2-binding protein 1 [Mortierella sp. GBA30]